MSDTLELPLPLNDVTKVELPLGSEADSVYVENDVGWIRFNLTEEKEIELRRFVVVSEFAPVEENYQFIGTLRLSEGNFDVFEIVEM